MNTRENRYTRFALCREMLQTPSIIRDFRPGDLEPVAALLNGAGALLLTGEGSSRLFPAKRTRAAALRRGGAMVPFTEGATQAMEYNLAGTAVLGASNSGRTRELVRLFRSLREAGHRRLGGITAHTGTVLESVSDVTHVLNCGPEDAVAATKSVMEQAMCWQAVFGLAGGRPFPDTAEGAALVEEALNVPVPADFSRSMANARTIYFAGRNDGVAEELTLKTNEIVRVRSDFLEGTYAAHGIEEIMDPDDVIVLTDPFPAEEDKFHSCLVNGVGAKVFAVADRPTRFPTLIVPARGDWKEYVLLAAGWNLLAEAGITAGVDLDKPRRARKVGNEVEG